MDVSACHQVWLAEQTRTEKSQLKDMHECTNMRYNIRHIQTHWTLLMKKPLPGTKTTFCLNYCKTDDWYGQWKKMHFFIWIMFWDLLLVSTDKHEGNVSMSMKVVSKVRCCRTLKKAIQSYLLTVFVSFLKETFFGVIIIFFILR